MIYLDTHVVLWLHSGDTQLISEKAKALIESEDLLISPIVMLELEFLREIKRINSSGKKILADLQREIALQFCPSPFPEIAIAALSENWTRDPFDRIIVAQAKMNDAILLTKDRDIAKHYVKAVW